MRGKAVATPLSDDYDGDEMRYIYVMAQTQEDGPISFVHTEVEAEDSSDAYCKGFDKLGKEGKIPERVELHRNDYVIAQG